MASRSRALRLPLFTIGLVALAVVGWRYSPTELLAVVQQAERHWPLAVLGLAGLYLVRPFFLWPLSVFSVFIGYLFGFPTGLPVVLFGTLLTCFPRFSWPPTSTTWIQGAAHWIERHSLPPSTASQVREIATEYSFCLVRRVERTLRRKPGGKSYRRGPSRRWVSHPAGN